MLAFAVRALLPQGFMPVASSHILTVQICADASGLAHIRQIVVPDRQPDHSDGRDRHTTCAFASHAMPLLGGADVPLLVEALLFVMALALSHVTPVPAQRPTRLRPPLRAPPVFS